MKAGLQSPSGLVVAATTLLVCGVALSSPVVAIGGPLAAALWWHWSGFAGRRAAAKATQADIIDLVDGLIQHLKTGGSLRRALRDTGGDVIVAALTPHPLVLSVVDEQLRPMAAGVVEGAGTAEGVGAAEEAEVGPAERRAPELRLLVSTIAVLVERGGPALPSLERLSDTLRSSQALQAENEMQAGQATASIAALVALPGLFIAGLALADERLRRFYLFEAWGAACLLGAMVASYAGWWVMHRLIWADQ